MIRNFLEAEIEVNSLAVQADVVIFPPSNQFHYPYHKKAQSKFYLII
jgi:hypothetical protein